MRLHGMHAVRGEPLEQAWVVAHQPDDKLAAGRHARIHDRVLGVLRLPIFLKRELDLGMGLDSGIDGARADGEMMKLRTVVTIGRRRCSCERRGDDRDGGEERRSASGSGDTARMAAVAESRWSPGSFRAADRLRHDDSLTTLDEDSGRAPPLPPPIVPEATIAGHVVVEGMSTVLSFHRSARGSIAGGL